MSAHVRRLFVVSAVLLVVALAAPRARAADDAAFQNFDAWLTRHQAARAATQAQVAAADVAPESVDEGRRLARERRAALVQLARRDPKQALARALRRSALRALPPSVQAESEVPFDICGANFGFQVGDDFAPGSVAPVSRVSRTLTIGDKTYEAQVFGKRLGTTSKPIHANGILVGGVVVLNDSPLRRMDDDEAAEDETVRAQCGAPGPHCIAAKVGAQTLIFRSEAALRKHQAALEEDEGTLGLCHPALAAQALNPVVGAQDAGGVTAASAWTTGLKTVLFIRVDMSDKPGDPVSAATAQSTVDVNVSNYYRDSSYGKTSMVSTVTPTLRLPHTAAEYEATLGDGQILTDGKAAAVAAGYDPASYDRYIVAFPQISSLGYAGKGYIGAPGVWLNGSFGAGVMAHELGHNYGVWHANLWLTTDGSVIGAGANQEYGNPFDVMGNGGITGQFNAWFKTRVEWLLSADYTNVTGSGIYHIGAVDDPAENGTRALKIVKDATKNYWVEYRKAYTSNKWAMNGAMVNWGYNTNTGSHLLDMTPGSSSNASDAPLLVGTTFSDTANGIYMTPLLRGSSGMDIAINMGTFPGNVAPTGSLTANPATVPRNGQVTLSVAASDANGDSLAYGWVFDDGTLAANAATVTKSWSTAGTKPVSCVVSDMVGGTTTVQTTVVVTSATATPTPRGGATPTSTAATATRTPTATGSPTATSTPRSTATATLRPTATRTATSTATATATSTPTVAPVTSFYTVSPCRVLDTRTSAPPALLGGGDRTFTLAGSCGIPSSAKAVSINVTVTQSGVPGDLRLYPAGTALPIVSIINYAAGQTRANNAFVTLGSGGAVTVHTDQGPGTTVHFILDVNGYFQ